MQFKDFKWLYQTVETLPNWKQNRFLVSGVPGRYESSQFFQSAQALDARKSERYWSTGRELFARAFSTVIHERMRDCGVRNDFASRYSAPGQFDQQSGHLTSPNPEGAEVAHMKAGAEMLIEAFGRQIKAQLSMAQAQAQSQSQAPESDPEVPDDLMGAPKSPKGPAM